MNYRLILVLLLSINVYSQEFKSISDSTPLSIEYILDKTNQMPLYVHVQGKTDDMSTAHIYPSYHGTSFPIHGLYPNQTNIITIRCGTNKKIYYKIKTKEIIIHGKKKIITLNTKINKDLLGQTDIYNQDMFFVSMPNNNYILGFDRQGDIRYAYHQSDKHYVMRMEFDKDILSFRLINSNQYYQQIDLMGNFIFNKKMNVHHEAIPYKNGELILANSEWGWEDAVFMLDSNQKIIKKYLIGDTIRAVALLKDLAIINQVIFDEYNIYTNNGKPKRIDWAHANSLVYDEKLDRLYISLRHQGLLAINMSEWKLEWFFVDDGLKIKNGLKYSEKPITSKYISQIPSLIPYRMRSEQKNGEPRGQHALFLRKNGNLLMFDNQADTKINTNGSRIIEYQFCTNMIAKIINEFRTIQKNYARFVSDVDLTGNNYQNKLILFGFGKPRRIIEIDSNNKILFDLEINTRGVLYRVDKYPLYPHMNPKLKYSLDYISK